MNSQFSEFRTGVIGVGSMGVNHVRILKEISNLSYISDINESLGMKVSNDYGVKFVKDYKDMLDKIDAVFIVVPTKYHMIVAKDVIDMQIPALIEKPLAANFNDAKFISDGFKNNKIKLCVGHIERYNPTVRKAKELLEKNIWGDILSIASRRFSPYPSRIQDVGVLFDLAIHDVDLVSYLSNSFINQIHAFTGNSRNTKYEDYADLNFKLRSGVFASCQTNWLTCHRIRELSLTTRENYVNLDLLKQQITVFSEHKENPEIIKVPYEEPLRNEIQDFLASIKGDFDPISSSVNGLEAVKIIEYCMESSLKNKVIKIQ